MLNKSAHSLTRCKKNICFRKGRNDYEAECLVRKSETYISVVHKGNGDLNTHLQSEKHRKAVRGAVASPKMTNCFVTAGSKRENKITAAEGTLAFRAVKHHHSFFPWHVHWFYLKRFSLILM